MKSVMVSSGRELARSNYKIVARFNVHEIMYDFVHHNSSELMLIAPVFQIVQPKSVKHLRNTIVVAVLIHNKSGSSTLDHLNVYVAIRYIIAIPLLAVPITPPPPTEISMPSLSLK